MMQSLPCVHRGHERCEQDQAERCNQFALCFIVISSWCFDFMDENAPVLLHRGEKRYHRIFALMASSMALADASFIAPPERATMAFRLICYSIYITPGPKVSSIEAVCSLEAPPPRMPPRAPSSEPAT